jgi:hypothetical protein
VGTKMVRIASCGKNLIHSPLPSSERGQLTKM